MFKDAGIGGERIDSPANGLGLPENEKKHFCFAV